MSDSFKYDPNSEEAKMDKPTPILIGSGFGRTGTNSLKAGLNVLGYKCYHMKETSEKGNKGHPKIWSFLYEEKYKLQQSKQITSFKEWDKLTLDYHTYGKYFEQLFDSSGYTASCDWPSCMFYLEIMEYYKRKGLEYKVILTVRDSGEAWGKSYLNTLAKITTILDAWNWKLIPATKEAGILTKNIFKLTFGDGDKRLDKEYTISKYNEWIESVQQFVDEDKLLVYNVKQGWTPLVKFLELDIPKKYADKPDSFIRTNDSKEMSKGIVIMERVNMVANVVVSAVVTGIVAYFAWKVYDPQ